MKQYVVDFAVDVLNQDHANSLMREDVRQKRKENILSVLDNYQDGFYTTREAICLIADYVL